MQMPIFPPFVRLAAEKKIKYSMKFVIEKQSDESLEKIYNAYVAKQLDEVNATIADALIDQTSNLVESVGAVKDGKQLKEELKDSEFTKRDLKKYISYVVPYIPLIGLACGAIIIGKHIISKRFSGEKEEEEEESKK